MRKVILISLLFLFTGGCRWFFWQDEIITTPEYQLSKPDAIEIVKWKERVKIVNRNLSWIQTILIIGGIASVAACFIGSPKLGMTGLAICGIGYALAAAGKYYEGIVAIVGLIVGLSAGIYALWKNRTVLKEIVSGGELFKTQMSKQAIAKMKDAHNQMQKHEFTKKVVEKFQKVK